MADMTEGERPHWATRIRREREARRWSQITAVANLEALFAKSNDGREAPATRESLVRQWKAWEAGAQKPTTWAPLLARLFGTVDAELFGPDVGGVDQVLIAEAGMDTAELIARLTRSTITDATVTAARVRVEQLCTAYRLEGPGQLRREGQEWLRRICRILAEGHPSLRQHAELLQLAGVLALLIGCVENDAGDRTSAETTRAFALELGREVDDPHVVGWAHEMSAWFALTDGDLHRVIAAAETGIEAAGRRGVSVQLAGQQAKAWARLGNVRQVELALERGRDILEAQPAPHNPDDHFTVDPGKWTFYEMDARRIVGDNDLARLYAEEVLRAGVTPDGVERAPMRVAEARVTLAVLAVRDGAVDQAAELGLQALSGDRVSVPSLTMVGTELNRAFAAAGLADDARARDYAAALAGLAA